MKKKKLIYSNEAFRINLNKMRPSMHVPFRRYGTIHGHTHNYTPISLDYVFEVYGDGNGTVELRFWDRYQAVRVVRRARTTLGYFFECPNRCGKYVQRLYMGHFPHFLCRDCAGVYRFMNYSANQFYRENAKPEAIREKMRRANTPMQRLGALWRYFVFVERFGRALKRKATRMRKED
jgi:hypothetical protein